MKPNNDLQIVYSGKIDDELMDNVKQTLMLASSGVNDIGKHGFAAKIEFHGDVGHKILEELKKRRWTFGSTLKKSENGGNRIIVSLGKSVTVTKPLGPGRGGSIDGLIVPGIVTGVPASMLHNTAGIIIEKSENPKVTITIKTV